MSTGAQVSELEQLLEGGKVRRNLKPAELTELAVARKEAVIASNGAVVATTGKRTGRSPKDRFIVKDSTTAAAVPPPSPPRHRPPRLARPRPDLGEVESRKWKVESRECPFLLSTFYFEV